MLQRLESWYLQQPPRPARAPRPQCQCPPGSRHSWCRLHTLHTDLLRFYFDTIVTDLTGMSLPGYAFRRGQHPPWSPRWKGLRAEVQSKLSRCLSSSRAEPCPVGFRGVAAATQSLAPAGSQSDPPRILDESLRRRRGIHPGTRPAEMKLYLSSRLSYLPTYQPSEARSEGHRL